MEYKPSEVAVAVHAKRPTALVAEPSEIGSETDPADEGTEFSIAAMLMDNKNSPIPGKTLHLIDPCGTELDTQVTDTVGIASFTYTVNAEHDGQALKIKYLGN